MAYRDYNGGITIDVTVAKSDVRKIKAATAKLEQARRTVNELMQQSCAIKGKTAQMIVARCEELIRNLENLIADLQHEVTAINQIVEKYKHLGAAVHMREE